MSNTWGDLQQSFSPGALPGIRVHTESAGPLPTPSAGLDLNADDVKNGLGRLVLTLVRLLHELLERQALRRIDAGGLTEVEIENLGLTLMKQAQEIERLRKAFNLEERDLNLDLGPLGKLL